MTAYDRMVFEYALCIGGARTSNVLMWTLKISHWHTLALVSRDYRSTIPS